MATESLLVQMIRLRQLRSARANRQGIDQLTMLIALTEEELKAFCVQAPRANFGRTANLLKIALTERSRILKNPA